MAMESYVKGVSNDYEKQVQTVKPQESTKAASTSAPKDAVQLFEEAEKENADESTGTGKEKEPAKSTIDSAISGMNAKMSKTRCAYAYDEDTKRITIKVYDDETDELIREVPPEKSLEVLKKIWELAGIIIDEKR
jgi:flagellar protein FlaG